MSIDIANEVPDEVPHVLSRDVIRSRRKREQRATTIDVNRLAKRDLEAGCLEYPEDNSHLRPRSRGECENGIRPCPFVSCAHHLYLDVNPKTGSIKLNFPDLEIWELKDSCVLDVADRGGATLEDTGEALNVTRERVRQIEAKALKLEGLKNDLNEFVVDDCRKPVRSFHDFEAESHVEIEVDDVDEIQF